MTKLVLNDIASLTNEQAALAALNSNSQAIETWSDSVLSRDGTVPNQMSADLDMNSNQILNIGDPLDMNGARIVGLDDAVALDEPVTLNQFQTGVASTGAAPVTMSFVTISPETALTNERQLTASAGISLTDGGANSTAALTLDLTHDANALHPTISTDNAIARYDSVGGNLQDSGVIVSDTNDLTVPSGLRVGFTGAPTADRIELGDATFYLGADVGNPRLTFDTGDFFHYDRRQC
jgi:hypothetical protein